MTTRLAERARYGMRLGLDAVDDALRRVGRPERRFPAIHVAGSNGKGSTSAFAAHVLAASGLRTGLFTSPHLVRLEERVAWVGPRGIEPVEAGVLLDALARLDAALPDFGALTFFEILTVAGFLVFAEGGADVVVVEAGIGARLDATRRADATVGVLTELTLEHTAVLGPTLEAIAADKVHVARAGRPLVAVGLDGPPRDVVVAHARRVGAPLHVLGADGAPLHVLGADGAPLHGDRAARGDATFTVTRDHRSGRARFALPGLVVDDAPLGLLGAHQARNAALALEATRLHLATLGRALDPAVARAALAATRWPGRLEQLAHDRVPVILDGAHNLQGVEAFVAAARDVAWPIRGPLALVVGVLDDKAIEPMLAALAGLAAHVVFTRPAGTPRALSPEALAARLPRAPAGGVALEPDVGRALAAACAWAEAHGGGVAIVGSLYLVGEARAQLMRPR
jgi:dihydrofolate synthase/folylpolyglutamate synthase